MLEYIKEERGESVLEAADRNDVHAVFSMVGVVPDASEHHLE